MSSLDWGSSERRYGSPFQRRLVVFLESLLSELVSNLPKIPGKSFSFSWKMFSHFQQCHWNTISPVSYFFESVIFRFCSVSLSSSNQFSVACFKYFPFPVGLCLQLLT